MVTHPQFEAMFKKWFPAVSLQVDQSYIQAGRTSASVNVSGAISYLLKELSNVASSTLLERCISLAMVSQSDCEGIWLAELYTYKRHTDELVLKVQNIIDVNYCDMLPLAQLAQAVNLSESSLKRRFKLAATVSLTQYKQRVRIARIKYLLMNARDTFENISERVGYNDPSSARRVFQEIVGQSPKEYRRSFVGGSF